MTEVVVFWVQWTPDESFQPLFKVEAIDGMVELLGRLPAGVNFRVVPEGVNPNG